MHYAEFKISNPRVLETLVECFPFATIAVNGTDGAPAIAHAPVVFQQEPKPNGSVAFHLSNNNPVVALMQEGAKATLVVHGPNCPVSPSWYKARFPGDNPDRSQTAPTHDYVNATLHGGLQVLSDAQLSTQIGKLVSHMEPPAGKGWQMREIDPGLFKNLKGMITGFRMPIETFNLTAKISQEQNPADRPGIISGLQQRGSFHDVAMAQIVEHYNGTPESLIEGLQAISPIGNAVRGTSQTLFRRVALSLERT